MRIIGIAQVRNESDIIEIFCRYHFQFLDGIIIMDHLSVDLTPDILQFLKEEGFPLDIRDSHDPAINKSLNHTEMMRMAVEEQGADWVLPLDADEFLTSIDGSSFRENLGNAKPNRPVLVPWRTYIPKIGKQERGENTLELIDHRLKEEFLQFYKTMAPASLVRKGTKLSTGSHWLQRPGSDKAVKPFEKSTTLVMAHFPVRSSSQIAAKAFAGWLAACSDPGRREDQGYHWKKLYHRFMSGYDLSDDELNELAINYLTRDDHEKLSAELVCDPVTPEAGSIALKYTVLDSALPLTVLAMAAEKLAHDYRRLRMESDRRA